LIGNGWLRESAKNPWPGFRQKVGDSVLRKCMLMRVPDEIRALVPPPSQRPEGMLPQPVAKPLPPIVAHRRDPHRDAREFPAFSPRPIRAPEAHAAPPGPPAAPLHASAARPAWWEDPVALGSLLILFPPIGLAAVWTSKRYGNDARWALTVMTGLTMCLITAVVIAVLAR